MKKILGLLLILAVLTCNAIDVKKIVSSTMTSGGSFTCTSTSQSQVLKLAGSPALAGNFTVIPDGGETAGMSILIENTGTPTLAGGHIVLFGTQVPDHLAAKKWTATAICTSVGNWVVTVTPTFTTNNIVSSYEIQDTTIVTADIKDKAVSLVKMADLTRGSLITGQTASNIPTALVGKNINYILGGDGTDIVSYPTDGDVTATIIGGKWTFAVGASKVVPTMIAASCIGNGLQGGAGSVISIKPNTTNGTSVGVAANGINLTNDETTPGANKVYGTNSAGTKGWQSMTGVVYEVKIVIPTASVLTLNGTPILAISSPGVGKAIVVESAVYSCDFNSAAYNTNTTLQVITNTASQAQLTGTSFLASGKDEIIPLTQVIADGKSCILEAKDVNIMVETGNPGVGDSDITIYLKYRIITL